MMLKGHLTESLLFRLHYKVTSIFLLACSLLVAFNVFYGTPMTCISSMEYSTSYCWSHGTMSVKDAMEKKVGIDVPYPGVDAYRRGSDYISHSYYKWIYIILLVQAVLFYLPKALWIYLEGGALTKIAAHTSSIGNPSFCDDEMSDEKKLRKLSLYLNRNRGHFNTYAYYYHFCEFLSVVNVVFQIIWLNSIFAGDFLSFASQLSNSYQNEYQQHLFSIFPLVTKCTIRKFGSRGDVELHGAMCNLPVNALTEKIYVFLLFWLFLLLVFSCLGVVKTFLTRLFWQVRRTRLRWAIDIKIYGIGLDVKVTSDVAQQADFGDWFVLMVISRTTTISDFKTLLMHFKDMRLKHAQPDDEFDANTAI